MIFSHETPSAMFTVDNSHLRNNVRIRFCNTADGDGSCEVSLDVRDIVLNKVIDTLKTFGSGNIQINTTDDDSYFNLRCDVESITLRRSLWEIYEGNRPWIGDDRYIKV